MVFYKINYDNQHKNSINVSYDNYILQLLDIEFEQIDSNKIYCTKACDVDNKLSKDFFKIQEDIDLIKETMKENPFIELFKNLIYGNSETFYKGKMNEYPHYFKVPDDNDFKKFIKIIKELKMFCVCIGTSELLAPFAIFLLNKIKDHVNIEDDNNEKHIISIIYKIGYIISSMKEEYWNARRNQDIIIDTLLDEPDINEEPWGIKNAMLALIMKSPIHKEEIKNGEIIYTLDLEKALKEVKCRVTRDEICLIYTILNKNKNKFLIKCYSLKDNFWIYFIYKI